jgi:AraC-like DNA-binding protein
MRQIPLELMERHSVVSSERESPPDWTFLAEKSGYCRHRLAKYRHISVRTLDRFFQKHLALTVHKWLDELQLRTAYDQVVTGKPLKEISYDLGFKQQSHFTKCFKARFGVPPSLISANRANHRCAEPVRN